MKRCVDCNQVWPDELVVCPTDGGELEEYDVGFVKSSHCSYCGAAFGSLPWPRRCPVCRNVTYLNPVPVAVLVLPVDDGVLLVRRSLGATRGLLALPGGFVSSGESWQQAATRELFEETGVTVAPEAVLPFRVVSAPDDTLLVFGIVPAVTRAWLPPFVPNDEVSEYVVGGEDDALAFPTHTSVLREYFSSRRS